MLLDNITDGDNDNITDMSIEFSFKKHNQNWNTFRLVLKDMYYLDESKLDWSKSYYKDSDGNKWARKDGMQENLEVSTVILSVSGRITKKFNRL